MRWPPIARVLPLACLLAGACGPYELDCEDLFDVLDTDGGLTLTEREHPVGWGQERCFTCHSVERIHVLNCTGLDEVDLAQIRAEVRLGGIEACASCHGDNGVTR